MFSLVSGQFVGMSFEEVMTQLVEMGLDSAINMDDFEEGYYIYVEAYGQFCEMYFDNNAICDSCVADWVED